MKSRLMLSLVAMLLVSMFAVSAADIDMDMTPVAMSQAGNPGDVVTFTFNVKNYDDNETLDVSFSASDLTDGVNTISAPTVSDIDGIAILGNEDGTFDLTVPSSLPAGAYAGTLTATDKINASNTDTEAFILTVNAVDDYTLGTNVVTLAAQNDANTEVDISVTNTGSTDLATFDAVYTGDYIDDDNDELTFTYDLPTALAPGETGTLTIHVDIENHMDIDSYDGNVSFTANGVSKDVAVTTKVLPKICKDGKIGDLKVSIDEPDSGENFKPGEEMDIDVSVENEHSKDLDVRVEAILYNVDEDDEIKSVESSVQEINDGDEESYNLKLFIPTAEMDDDDLYYLYVKAFEDGEERDNCDYDSVEIDLDRDENDVVIDDFTLTPENVKAGEQVHVTVDVENIGTEDQDDVYVEINEPELDLDEKSPYLKLDEYDDSDNDYRWELQFTVPEDTAAGDYYLAARVYFDDDDEYDEQLVKLTVTEGAASSDDSGAAAVTGGVVVGTDQDTLNLAEGQKKFTIPLLLENNGDSVVELTLDVTEYSSWAKLIGVESPEKLNPGDKYHTYVYLQLKDDVVPGIHNLRVNTREGDALLTSKLMGVNVQGGHAEETTVDEVVEKPVVEEDGKVKSFFKDKSKIFWIIGDLILIVLAVVFVRMLFKK